MTHTIIFGSSNDYWKASYRDASKYPGMEYIPGMLPELPKVIRKLHTAHCCIPFSLKTHLPLKKLWYKYYYREKYIKNDDYIFIFFYEWYPIFQNGYLEFLKKNYSGCKCVLNLCDINSARKLDMGIEKHHFDHIMVFEKNFAKENEIEYYPLVYSDYRDEVKTEEKDIDLLFVGWAKGRYKLLKQIYDRLTAKGINCQFYLSKLDEEVQNDSGIHTVDWVPYSENMKLLKRAKCLLDIIPPNTDCNTLRVSEAMSFKCRILTNNIKICSEEYYDSENISVYDTPEAIDIDFFKRPYKGADYNGYIAQISPAALAKHLTEIL